MITKADMMTKSDAAHLEGAVDVNGDITPITRIPISHINADNWDNMSMDELMEQKSALLQRRQIAGQYSPAIVLQLDRGILRLDTMIISKSKSKSTTNTSSGLI
jgi:hypothetical protein